MSTKFRQEILDEVKNCVCKDRQTQYGDPEDNFANIAKLINVVLKLSLTPVDVAVIMACVKLARISNNKEYEDNWVDLAGYAVCGGGLIKANKEKLSQK